MKPLAFRILIYKSLRQLASLKQAEPICKSPDCQGLFFYEKCENFYTPDYRSHKVDIALCTNKGFREEYQGFLKSFENYTEEPLQKNSSRVFPKRIKGTNLQHAML